MARLSIVGRVNDNSPDYQAGQILQIKGQVRALADEYRQPWLSGLAAAQARQGIFCQIQAYSDDVIVLGRRTTDKSLVEIVRERIIKSHLQFLGTKAGGLLASMVLGDQAVSLDQGLLDAFRKIGLSHIVAASGFNLTVVTMITYWILRTLCCDKRLVTLIVGGNVLIYAALAGLSASIVRAAITCILVLIATYFHRRLHGLATLSFVLIVNVIADPTAILEPGGQLSYAATAGIICGAEIMAGIILFGSNNKLAKIFSATLAVILMAQLAVLPVQLFHFRQMGLLFLPANLLIDPFVTPVTIAGFLASVAAIINLPGLPLGVVVCQWLDWLAAIPLQIIICVTEKLASFDLTVLNTGRPLVVAIVFYYAMFAVWLLYLQKKRFRLLATVLFFCSLAALFYQPPLKQPVIVILSRSIICINEQRKAFCFGSSNRQTNKILAYYAANRSGIVSLPLLLSKEEKITVQEIKDNGLMLIVNRNNAQHLYVILFAKKKGGKLLSKSQFINELHAIDFRICCPGKAISFYSLGTGNSLNSSVL